jgi:hypothetical protein
VVIVASVGAWNALAWRSRTATQASAAGEPVDTVSFSTSSSAVMPQSSAGADSAAAAEVRPAASSPTTADPAAARPTTTPAVATPAAPPVVAIIGASADFGEGVTANRADSVVTVLFDTPELRTRIPEKFERFLRATLPRVYGPAIEPALAAVPVGGLAAQGSLLSDLPTRGIRVPLSQGWTLAVYPETRPGQDGPLVVRYRSVIRKD